MLDINIQGAGRKTLWASLNIAMFNSVDHWNTLCLMCSERCTNTLKFVDDFCSHSSSLFFFLSSSTSLTLASVVLYCTGVWPLLEEVRCVFFFDQQNRSWNSTTNAVQIFHSGRVGQQRLHSPSCYINGLSLSINPFIWQWSIFSCMMCRIHTVYIQLSVWWLEAVLGSCGLVLWIGGSLWSAQFLISMPQLSHLNCGFMTEARPLLAFSTTKTTTP